MTFVPSTTGSELKKMYEEEVGKSHVKVKVVESAGRSIKSMLQKSDTSINERLSTSREGRVPSVYVRKRSMQKRSCHIPNRLQQLQ